MLHYKASMHIRKLGCSRSHSELALVVILNTHCHTPAGSKADPCPYLHASHFLEPRNGVTEGVDSYVAHVQLARRVWEHGEHIEFGLRFLGESDKGR